MPSMPWFRVYSDILRDKKIKRVSEKLREPKALVIGIWVIMLAIANESEDRGKLMITQSIPMGTDDLASETGLKEEKFLPFLEEFKTLEMITWDEYIAIKNWHKRQYRSDDISIRVNKFRGKSDELEIEEVKEKKKAPKKATEYPILSDGLPEWVSEPLRAICRAFQEESGVITPVTFNTDWNKSLMELAAMEATPDNIREGVQRLRKGKMTIKRPGSIVGAVDSILKEGKTREIRLDADGNEVFL